MRERRLSDGKTSRLAVFSWILYDFSNTIFSVAILSFYFPLWVEEQVGSGGLFSGAGLVNSATAISALFVVLTAPVLGAAVGYIGTILGLVVLTYFVENGETVRPLLGPLGGWLGTGDEVYSNAFVPTAFIYLVFSLPAFFFVPDPAVRARRPVVLWATYRDVVSTVKNLRAYAGVGTFILATVLYTDAANTAIANMALYGRVVFEMDGTQVRNLLLFSTVFAVAGSAGFGLLTDRVGPKRSLVGVLVLWLVPVGLSATGLGAWMLFLAGPIVGIALGGMWTVGRVMLVALSPPEKLGEFFGLFSLAGKVSAVLGPALTAVFLFVFGGGAFGYRISIGSLAVIMAAGLFFLLRVPDARPERNVDEFAPKSGTPLDSPAPRAEDVRHEGEG